MKKIFDKILDPILYLVFSGSIAFSACTIFQSTYYKGIWVTGTSMEPTLVGSVLHSYGYEDKHDSALNNLERFDVITTFWPDEWNNDRPDETDKIKRLWGLPGETINLVYNKTEEAKYFTFSVYKDEVLKYEINSEPLKLYSDDYFNNIKVAEFHSYRRIFRTKIFNSPSEEGKNGIRQFTVTLADNEYFVMGDNWIDSNDSYKHVCILSLCNIQRKHLQGKVICIQGLAKYDYVSKKLYDRQKQEPRYYF